MIFPDIFLNSLFDITPSLLKKIGIEALILDVDNTLRACGSVVPCDEVICWVNSMKLAGIRMVIASNNFKKSIEPFALKLQLDYVFFSCKPLTFGLNRAAKKLKCSRNKIAVVGDQIFTDVVAGNLKGFRTFLIAPIFEERGLFFKIKRWLEGYIVRRCRISRIKDEVKVKKGK